MNFFQKKISKNLTNHKANVNAGAELLSRYQDEWKNIHSSTQESAKRAKDMSDMLDKTSSELICYEDQLKRFYTALELLPNLMQEVDSTCTAIGQLQETMHEVTCSLDLLEKISVEYQHCHKKQAALQELNEFRIAKRHELEKKKELLAKNHSLKLTNIQEKQAMHMIERQEALQKALSSESL